MKELEETLAELIRINSVNAYYEGGPGEGAIANWIEKFFAQRGIQTFRQFAIEATEHCDSRFNVIAVVPGHDRSRRILLEAHMDTVSTFGMAIPPFEPRIDKGKIYGRGACDTKAGLAAMMHTLASLHAEGPTPECDVWLAAVVDEEYSFRGVSKLCEEFQADAAIVAEPTELQIAIASKGVLRWRIHVRGKAAHSSKTHLGISAINHMARILIAIEADHSQLAKQCHPLLGPASVNVGRIHGGVQVNFVPDHCVIEIDRRLLPEESIDSVLGHYANMLAQLKLASPNLDAYMEEPMLIDAAWCVDPIEEIVVAAKQAADSIGLSTSPIGVPFGSDASKLGRVGIPTIIFGPGSIDQAHAEIEYVELEQVKNAFDFYKECVLRFGLLE